MYIYIYLYIHIEIGERSCHYATPRFPMWSIFLWVPRWKIDKLQQSIAHQNAELVGNLRTNQSQKLLKIKLDEIPYEI